MHVLCLEKSPSLQQGFCTCPLWPGSVSTLGIHISLAYRLSNVTLAKGQRLMLFNASPLPQLMSLHYRGCIRTLCSSPLVQKKHSSCIFKCVPAVSADLSSRIILSR